MKKLSYNRLSTRIRKTLKYRLWLPVLLGLVTVTAMANESDRRQVIPLNDMQRSHVLGEMRTLLSGLQNILSALASDDMEAVAQQARLLGMNMGHKAENHLHGVLPEAFMQLGLSIHRDFDRIAADAELRKDPKHTLRQLSTAMNTCAACHESYELQAEQVNGRH